MLHSLIVFERCTTTWRKGEEKIEYKWVKPFRYNTAGKKFREDIDRKRSELGCNIINTILGTDLRFKKLEQKITFSEKKNEALCISVLQRGQFWKM